MSQSDQKTTFDDLNLQVFNYNIEHFNGKPVICAVNICGAFSVQVTRKGAEKFPRQTTRMINRGDLRLKRGGAKFPVSSPEDFTERAFDL